MWLSVAVSSVSFAAADSHAEMNEFEWAGTFVVSDTTHTWIMQKTGTPAEYADPSMKLAVISSEAVASRRFNRAMAEAGCAPADPLFEQLEDAANTLLAGSCTQVNEGETFGPFTSVGECFELVNDPAKDTSKFIMNTAGITGKVIFAQHVPTEFERDMHYLQNSAQEDVDPESETGGEHSEHSHGDDDDDESHTCACEAEELNVNLDCSATAAMEDALAFLQANACACDCDSDECMKNWLIVQAHHDYCDPADVPGSVNDDFHDFDEVCKSCEIERQFIADAPTCPTPTCDDQSGNEAYAALVENLDCKTNCAGIQSCRDNYQTLRIVHDGCDHEVLSEDAERGIHDFEGPCAAVVCNTLSSAEESGAQLVCNEDSGASVMNLGLAALLAAVGTLAFLN